MPPVTTRRPRRSPWASAGPSTTRPSGITRSGTAYFEDRVHLLGGALGVEFDEIAFEVDYAQTTEDLDLGSWAIPAGCVAAMDYRWQGRIGGRTIVEFRSRLIKGQTLDPAWTVDHGFFVEIQGRPTVKTKVDISHRPTSEPRRRRSSWCCS